MDMGTTSSIKVSLDKSIVSSDQIILALLSAGWRISYEPYDIGGIEFLPLGDNGNHDWQAVSIEEWPYVLEIIRQKIAHKEEVGIALHYEDTGCNFYFDSDGVSVRMYILRIGRRTLPDSGGTTDYSWYLSHILPTLIKMDYMITDIECADHS
jgi:hypothetical protein